MTGFDVPYCERCGLKIGSKRSPAFTMSMFNTQNICVPCKATEKKHTMYVIAVREDLLHVGQNFPGIGLPPDLQPIYCGHCNGYGSSLYEAADRCTSCDGNGLAPGESWDRVRLRESTTDR